MAPRHQHPFGGLGSSVLPCSASGVGGKELSFSTAPRGFKGVLVWVWLSRPVFVRQLQHSPRSVSEAAVPGPIGTWLSGKWDRHGVTSSLTWCDLPCPVPSFYTLSLPFRRSPQRPPARTAHCRHCRHPDPSPLPTGSRQPSRLSAGACQCPSCPQPLWAPAAAGIACLPSLHPAPCLSLYQRRGSTTIYPTDSRGWARSNCYKERWGYLSAHEIHVCSTSYPYLTLCIV